MQNLENVIAFAAVVWAIVTLIKHFAPDAYTSTANSWENTIHARLNEVETKLENLTKKD